MKEVLIIGAGGREHALAWKAAQSPLVDKVYCAPGNPGIAEVAECIPISETENDRLANFAEEKKDHLITIVGGEKSLNLGIVNEFESRGLLIFGPSKLAVQIETSKVFAKELMRKYQIPTSEYQIFLFKEVDKAMCFVESRGTPLVVKADGLAEGKGAIIAFDTETAKKAIDDILVKKIFPEGGDSIIIEDFLEGDEISITVIANGREFVPFLLSQDHKKAYDGDTGPNTGGMGAYARLPWVSREIELQLLHTITQSTLDALAEEGINYQGVLYSNVMLTPQGPIVLEHNARFGDPEAQALLPLLESDLVEVLYLTLEGKIKDIQLNWSGKSAVCLTIASSGYPDKDKYETGKIIEGLEEVKKMEDVLVFHAGTKTENGKLVTAGGRVLSIVALDDSVRGAVKKVYEAANKVNFDKIFYRFEIAKRALTKKAGSNP